MAWRFGKPQRIVAAKANQAQDDLPFNGNSMKLTPASEECKRDREIVTAAVRSQGAMLCIASEELRADRQVVLAAVSQNGLALRHATEELKEDHDIVLAAVTQRGTALEFASNECQGDPRIVLAAVGQDGNALQFVAEKCKREREIVLAAMQRHPSALQFATEELLLDATFASEVKQKCYILRIGLMSGRQIYAVSPSEEVNYARGIIAWCCEQFGVEFTGEECLVCGTAVVPEEVEVRNWPCINPPGEISQYELVLSSAP
eukprot:3947405-Amphidinium_carterae.1